ncbi:MAG TPA: 3-hydroxyacyl-CoA dehydrogenase [Spirochaetota bacterium]|nr:3-hydroxyacyl-CoA dehydrogenase [Spirochaetota bacterium]HPG51401.1 3-hydroxyacyl-CoA dehydrogenase [Spirochaetota bacterium]HPN11563.1 3-hydroxyacyl-CoA dehydrogenase [Spirochaetota bacterium]HQL81528.1 3-hydroxyacyl-CoA dehydrogenase [Spirochaetota bacterium]
MKSEEIKQVLVVGAGTMGQQITVPCITHGLNVVIYDIHDAMLQKAVARIRKMLDGLVKWQKITADDADAAMKRVRTTTDLPEAARDIDIVSESVPEDPKLKGEIFAKIHAACPERTIFTTNTSTLLPSMFAGATGRPEKLAALHFHDVRISTIVDVMPHPGTAQETMELVRDFAVRIGQTPIVMERESPGYVFNFMLSNLFQSAQTLAANGVASVEDVDRSWMGVTHMVTGPFGIMDSVGLDTVWKITNYWAQALKNPQQLKNAAFMKEYVDRGHLGEKTGRGFYTYPKPRFRDPDFIAGAGNK